MGKASHLAVVHGGKPTYLQHHGQSLIDRGYELIPIATGSKYPRGLDEWQTIEANSAELTKWISKAYTGAGIRTGRVVAIDIDVPDESLARQVAEHVELLVGADVVRIGHAPKLLIVFQTDAPMYKAATTMYQRDGGTRYRVEALGEGQQFVAYHIHPDTNRPYTWIGEAEPANTQLNDLPSITPDDVQDILDYAEQLLADAFAKAPDVKAIGAPISVRIVSQAESAESESASADDEVVIIDYFAETWLDEERKWRRIEITRLLEMLTAEHARDAWSRIIWGVLSYTAGAMVDELREWSMTDRRPKVGWDEVAFNQIVRDWRQDGRNGKSGSNVGTLYKIAQGKGIDLLRVRNEARVACGLSPREVDGITETYGDTSNGATLAREQRGRLLYIETTGRWAAYDERRGVWDTCANELALEIARDVAQQKLKQATDAVVKSGGSEAAKRDQSQALAVHRNAKRHTNMLQVARTFDWMRVKGLDGFDAAPLLLGVPNGIVNLETGALLPADRALMITKHAGALYVPEAECPVWERTIEQIFLNDAEVIAFFHLCVGYWLTGNVEDEKLFMFIGAGSNGKSLMLRTLERVFGSYSLVGSPTILTIEKNGSSGEARHYFNELAGKRLLSLSELPATGDWNDQIVKRIASTDRISTRRNYSEIHDFAPSHHPVILGNGLPGVRDNTWGFWRRLVLFYMRATFAGESRNSRLPDELRAELPGILAWCVRGAIRWCETRDLEAAMPASIKRDITEYRMDTDMLGQFLAERCVVGRQHRITATNLYEGYSNWCRQRGLHPKSQPSFGREIAGRKTEPNATGVQRKLVTIHKTARGSSYVGVTLREEVSEDVEL